MRNRQHSENISTEEYVKDVIKAPEEIKIECIISIGYPDEEKPPHNVEDLFKNKIHYEKF